MLLQRKQPHPGRLLVQGYHCPSSQMVVELAESGQDQIAKMRGAHVLRADL
jgi:hypothetical protein